MTEQHLDQVTKALHEPPGLIQAGIVQSFCFKGFWYPLRFTIIRACKISGGKIPSTTDECRRYLLNTGVITVIQQKSYPFGIPIEMTIAESMNLILNYQNEVNNRMLQLNKIMMAQYLELISAQSKNKVKT